MNRYELIAMSIFSGPSAVSIVLPFVSTTSVYIELIPILYLICLLLFIRKRRWMLRSLPTWTQISFNGLGIEILYKGDNVIWTWPWHRQWKGQKLGPWISLGFTGTGEWGDARFWTLKQLDGQWDLYFKAEADTAKLWDNACDPWL